MPHQPTLIPMLAFGAVFLVIWVMGFCLFLRSHRDMRRAIGRLRELKATDSHASQKQPNRQLLDLQRLPLVGDLFMPKEGAQSAHITRLLTQAGIHHPQALSYYVASKWLSILLLPLAVAVILIMTRRPSVAIVAVLTASAIVMGILAPELWLRRKVSERHRTLRCALPDALDMLVLCMDAGVSSMAAIQRVAEELHTVHPVLCSGLNVLHKEIHLGLPPGDAFKNLAERTGLLEVRDLATIILQCDQFGAGIAKTFRIFADGYRLDRQQRAEEKAQQAAVKIVFPTLLCIFPAIFIVLLGPAAFQITKIFAR